MTGTGDLNAAIEKQAGVVQSPARVGIESEPAALVPEGASAGSAGAFTLGAEMGIITADQEATLKAKAAAIEAYITAGVAKATASLGGAEIVTVSAFKAAVEALLRHLHADHPENYL